MKETTTTLSVPRSGLRHRHKIIFNCSLGDGLRGVKVRRLGECGPGADLLAPLRKPLPEFNDEIP